MYITPFQIKRFRSLKDRESCPPRFSLYTEASCNIDVSSAISEIITGMMMSLVGCDAASIRKHLPTSRRHYVPSKHVHLPTDKT